MNALLLAKLNWDPAIRGVLFPAIMFLILCGSCYVILATNVGNRLGFLLANAAFWGWMALMAITWMIYGIGLLGKNPKWVGREVIEDPKTAQLASVASLAGASGSEVKGWKVVQEGSGTRGEATAAVDAYLKQKVTDGGAQLYPATGGPFYASVAAYEQGGEQIVKVRPRKLKDGDWWNPRDYRWMGLFHGERHYVDVIKDYKLDENGSPITDGEGKFVIDETKPTRYVSMVRDLGSKRLPAFRIFLASTILFLVSVYSLHRRDKKVMAYAATMKPARA